MLPILGEAYLMAGRLADATDTAQCALALARRHHQRGREAWTLRLAGDIAVRGHRGNPSDPAGAEKSYQQALELAEDLKMRPLVAHCHLGLARLYPRMGQPERVGDHLTAAATMYRDMGMTHWLQKAEAEINDPS